MRAPDRFEFSSIAEDQREAIFAGSQDLLKGQNGIYGAVITLTLTVLAGLGGMAVVTVIAGLLDASPNWWMLIGWFAGAGLYMASFQLLYRQMARLITQRALHRAPQALLFDEIGMTYEAGAASWTTPWAMIDNVIEAKRTITIVVSGIAFALPRSAVGGPAACDALVADLNAQIESNLPNA